MKNASREAARARDPQFDRSRSALVEVEELVTRRLLRGAEDFAVVVAHGQGLLEFCLGQENQEAMPIEMRAVIKLGLGNSKDRTFG